MIRSTTARRPSGPGYRRPLAGWRLGAFDPTGGAISAAVGLAAAAVGDWMNSIQLSHNADTATTLIVNGLATQFQNLLNAYMAEPNPTCQDQRAALDAYDQGWAWLQSPAACGNPSYGSAGNRCISQRGPGGATPWATYYRNPIANDPRLSGMGCDTSQEVLLPSLATGTYAPSGITAAGVIDNTTNPAPATAAAPAVVITEPTTWPWYFWAAGAGALVLLLRGGK